MSQTAKRNRVTDAERYRAVNAARERFLAGDDRVRGVRPEVATSWYRCREQYRVDPGLSQAPAASAQKESSSEHTLEHEIVFAQLGGAAASIASEVESAGGVVTVTDGTARILTVQGDKTTLTRARDSNMAPWSCWSEAATGTNGMGTALEAPGPVLISGPEHWCRGLDEWVCAGVAVRDAVTHDPVAVLDVSAWRSNLPAQAAGWLSKAVGGARAILRQRAHDSGAELAAAFTQTRAQSGQGLAALDASGRVIIADEAASLVLGVPARVQALDPAVRWQPTPDFRRLARHAIEQAQLDHGWVGSTQVVTELSGEPCRISLRPVFLVDQPIGTLAFFGSEHGEPIERERHEPGLAPPSRIVGVSGESMILLRPLEVQFAEADGNDVWLVTEEGRLQAAVRGIDKLEVELSGGEFLRVHRRFLVNLSRVRVVERGPRGDLSLIMDGTTHEAVPVSRRNVPTVRRALGL
ncbi:LytTR family transcriptional regulator DNA-binding domain-containing protein [Solirubrobacter ginsenosidimutans]|uniref:LytTR family transcriptional regulator DNA-binding domain-containing protein n=1 Tax=Solirubrobacter ginsenosidimutans TaxID=490573 RepID=A0A9X3MPF0_9ACTN|nr:DNA-binding protein [Solirubrobacter ginsenosidimutans]MDA0159984.1 LytTR family transcriptional regulator DNA-binding domain-containing protein [Solirubrobacter ginsenosidimutans]